MFAKTAKTFINALNFALRKRGKRMTNFEKIKAMSVEEMAHFFLKICTDEGRCYFCWTCNNDCVGNVEKFLESEVEEDG